MFSQCMPRVNAATVLDAVLIRDRVAINRGRAGEAIEVDLFACKGHREQRVEAGAGHTWEGAMIKKLMIKFVFLLKPEEHEISDRQNSAPVGEQC